MKVSVICGLLTLILTNACASGVLTKVAHLNPMALVQDRSDFAEPGADPTEAMVAVKFKISPNYHQQSSRAIEARPSQSAPAQRQQGTAGHESTERQLDRTMKKLNALYKLKELARSGRLFKPGIRNPGQGRRSQVTPEMIEGIVMRAMDKYWSAHQGPSAGSPPAAAPQQAIGPASQQAQPFVSPLGSGGVAAGAAGPLGSKPPPPTSAMVSGNGRQPVPAPSFFRPSVTNAKPLGAAAAAHQATTFRINPVSQTPLVMPFKLNPMSQARGRGGPPAARQFGAGGRPSQPQAHRPGQAQLMHPSGSLQTVGGGRIMGSQQPQIHRPGQAHLVHPTSSQTVGGGRIMGAQQPQFHRPGQAQLMHPAGSSHAVGGGHIMGPQTGKPSQPQFHRVGQAQFVKPGSSQTVGRGHIMGPQQSQSRTTGQAHIMQPAGSSRTIGGGRIKGPQMTRKQWRVSHPQVTQSHRMGPASRSFVSGQRSMAKIPAADRPMTPLSGKIIEKPPTAEDLKAASKPKGKCDCPQWPPCGSPCSSPCAPQQPKDCSQEKPQSLPLPPPPVLEEVTNPIIPFSPPRTHSAPARILDVDDDPMGDIDFNFNPNEL